MSRPRSHPIIAAEVIDTPQDLDTEIEALLNEIRTIRSAKGISETAWTR